MKKIIGCAAILMAQFMLLQATVAEATSAEQGALEFQSARFRAMIDVDMDSLEKFLSDDLTYSHTTGWTETKSEFLSTVESGKIDYVSVTPRDVEVRIYGDIAVMTGLSDMRGAVGDRAVSFTIRFLDVSRRAGDSWQLVAWQSVRSSDNTDTPGDIKQLTAMLHDFLANSAEKEAHQSFWADDLVYTSSNGTRFGKADILAGFEDAGEDSEGPEVAYSGENVNVRIFGTTAVVTFQLVGTPDDGSAVLNYFNTGTFLKRNGKWQVVAWQATVIPN